MNRFNIGNQVTNAMQIGSLTLTNASRMLGKANTALNNKNDSTPKTDVKSSILIDSNEASDLLKRMGLDIDYFKNRTTIEPKIQKDIIKGVK